MRFISQTGTATVILLMMAVAFAVPANAQGLGDITVESALNQPLRAHIQLLDVGRFDVSQVKATLATDKEFEIAHVERNTHLALLKFQVEIHKDGTGDILVTSTDDISEPFLNFLVGVSWPGGRTLREYTLLLDLPQNSKVASAAKVSTPVTGAAAQTTASQNATSTSPALEYVVNKGDSLYEIAAQTRPSGSVGVQQMMVAIQRANEDAFVNNNVNRILVGKVLRIPRQDEINLIDQEAAVAQINQQNQELTAEPLAVNDSAGAKGAKARDELTLLSGDQDAGGGGSSDLDATIKSLKNQLMLGEESLDRSKLENLELTNRLSAVQEQIDLLQNIITIEDERIAQLQAQLSKQSVATKDAVTSAEAAATSASAGGTVDEIVALLSNSVVLLGAVLAVAVAVALMIFIKRRKAQAETGEDDEVSLDELADAAEAEDNGGGIRAMLTAFMSRFRRAERQDEDEPVFAPEPAAAPEVAVKPTAVIQPSTDKLLDEMGLSDDFKSPQDAPEATASGSGKTETASHPNAKPAEVAAAMPAPDTAVEEAGAVMEEAALLEQALHEAEQEVEHEDFLEAAPAPAPVPVAATPAVPETFAFTAEPVPAAAETPAAKTIEDKPQVFEFTLPSLDDLDKNEASTIVGTTTAAAPQEKVETVSFDTSALSLEDDDSILEIEDPLAVKGFDEESVQPDDEAGEESHDISGPQDTHDARLDLAVAYEAMGDIDGAVEILDEVIASGKTAQVSEAKRLKQKWQNG